MDTTTLILSVSGSLIVILLGVTGYFFKRAFEQIQLMATKEELECLREDVESNRIAIEKVKENYITKEDYFREQAKVDKKLDMIMSILMQIQKEGR